jgi:hypothetical protein
MQAVTPSDTMRERPTAAFLPKNIPNELQEFDQFVPWGYRWSDGKVKWDKPPLRLDGSLGSSTDPAARYNFRDAVAAVKRNRDFDGVGFVLTKDDPFTAIDLDKCVDPVSHNIESWAMTIIERLDSYTEISPSGTGIRIMVQATLPPGGRRKGTLEMYDDGRYVTITGECYSPKPVAKRQDAINALHAETFPAPAVVERRAPTVPVTLDDRELIERAKNAKNGQRFSGLWDGDVSGADGDHSKADLQLCGSLAFWTGCDETRIDRLFRVSRLMRAKWDEVHGAQTYGAMTVTKAIAGCRDTYNPAQGKAAIATPAQIDWGDIDPWPELDEKVLYGLAGDVVRLLAPHTEADPAALQFTFLAAVGNLIGKGPYLRVGPVQHEPRLYVLVVGASAKARKGQSLAEVMQILMQADPAAVESTRVSGLASGEGLIARLRDREDEAFVEKRALVHEPEFARVLAASGRENATLSAILRDAWDGSPLRVLTRKDPLEAKGAFISLVAHVTMEELVAKLTGVETANGFANRFLLVCAKRARLLPDGGSLPFTDVIAMGNRVAAAVERARKIGEVRRSAGFAEAWAALYPTFPDEPGLAGALVARAETQTLRLALIYALLDGNAELRSEHLTAAYAAWSYAEDSARHIFGHRLGDSVEQRLLDEIRSVYPGGLTGVEQSALFDRNLSAGRLQAARQALEKRQLINSFYSFDSYTEKKRGRRAFTSVAILSSTNKTNKISCTQEERVTKEPVTPVSANELNEINELMEERL